MSKLITWESYKLSKIGASLFVFTFLFLFLQGLFNFLPDLVLPQSIEKHNFAKKWGQQIKYEWELEEIAVEFDVKVDGKIGTRITPDAKINIPNLPEKYILDPISHKAGTKGTYTGRIRVHKDSLDITVVIQHDKCQNKTKILPIRKKTKEAKADDPVKIICYTKLIDEL